MLSWIQRLGIVVTVLITSMITAIASAPANPSSTRFGPHARFRVKDATQPTPSLLQKHTPNLRSEQTLATPSGNVTVAAGPDGTTTAQTFSLPGGSTQTSIGLGGLHGTIVKPAAALITCTLQVNNPHESGHNPGNVNVTGSLSCSAPVSLLDLGVGLYLNNYLVSSSYKYGYGTYLTTNAAASCLLPGVYAGGAVGAVTFPPGFVPPFGNFGGIEVYSPDIYLTC